MRLPSGFFLLYHWIRLTSRFMRRVFLCARDRCTLGRAVLHTEWSEEFCFGETNFSFSIYWKGYTEEVIAKVD